MAFHFDSNDLGDAELDYELLARNYGIADVSRRNKFFTLVQCLKKEKAWKSTPPGIGSSPHTPSIDIEVCDNIIAEVNETAQCESATREGLKRAFSQLAHVNLRLLRINATEDQDHFELQRLESLCTSLNALDTWYKNVLTTRNRSLQWNKILKIQILQTMKQRTMRTPQVRTVQKPIRYPKVQKRNQKLSTNNMCNSAEAMIDQTSGLLVVL